MHRENKELADLSMLVQHNKKLQIEKANRAQRRTSRGTEDERESQFEAEIGNLFGSIQKIESVCFHKRRCMLRFLTVKVFMNLKYTNTAFKCNYQYPMFSVSFYAFGIREVLFLKVFFNKISQ